MGGRKIKGKGDYKTFNLRGMAQKLDQALSSIPKGTFAKKGAQIGAKYGPLGALAGRGLGAGLSAVTGYGNYTVRSNSLSRVSTSVDMIPQFVKNDHSVRVVHREFIKDLVVPASPSSFDLQSFLINPANRDLFPWLASMALQYSQFKIHGMVFAYKTMSSDITAGGSLGTVVMATNYNSIDRAYANKIEMENSEFAVSTKPSLSLVHAIECDPKYSGLDVLYIRDPAYQTGDTDDRRFYDYGRFQVATTGLPGSPGTTLGELWVSYDIEFMKPILGGIAQQINGLSIISASDGTTSVGVTNHGLQTVVCTAPAYNPAVGGTENLLSSSYAYSGATGIVTALGGSVFSIDATKLTFRKNGVYDVYFHGSGNTTVTNRLFQPVGVSQLIAPANVDTGSAQSSVVALLSNYISGEGSNVSGLGFCYAVGFSVTVTGIGNAGDTVTFTPNVFALNTAGTTGTNMVNTVVKKVTVSWLGVGTNLQSKIFTS